MSKLINSGLFLTLMLPPTMVMAALFTVNETTDLADANPGDGLCEATACLGDCTLRAAVMEANETPGPHIIELPAGDFTLTIAGEGNDDASAGDLDIMTAVSIRGAGSAHSRVNGDNSIRVFHLRTGSLDLEDLTIQNGRAGNSTEFTGGGILAESSTDLTLRRVQMTGNVANRGGAIGAMSGNVGITDSLFTNNVADDLGFTPNNFGNAFLGYGAVYVVTGTTVAGNGLPSGSGSGRNNIYMNAGALTLVNSTVADNNNTAVQTQNADLFMSHTTIAGNHGSQLHTVSNDGTQTIEVVGSILRRTPWGFATCGTQQHVSLGYNISDDSSCGFTSTGDLEGTDPLLGPLQANGGPTPTLDPQIGSPAINLVPSGSCLDEDRNPLNQDQRGFPRPASGTANCDAGSVETGTLVIFEDRFES